MGIRIADVVGRGGCTRNLDTVDIDREPWVYPATTGLKGDVKCEQVISGLLDDDILLVIAFIAVREAVYDFQAHAVSIEGEGGLIGRVHILACGCGGELVAKKAVVAHFLYKNGGGPVCLDVDGASKGQLLGGYCQHLPRLGPDHAGKVDGGILVAV